jgi:replicative DNA helicase
MAMSIITNTKIQKILSNKTDSTETKLKKIEALMVPDEPAPKSNSNKIGNIFNQKLESILSKGYLGSQLNTGFGGIDLVFGGFHKSELVIFGGRPSMGKSQFLINLALHLIKTDKSVLFFSMQMSEMQVVLRIMAAITGIRLSNISTNKLSAEEIAEIAEQAKQIADFKLFVNDNCFDFSAFIPHCEQQIQENGTEIVFIDDIDMLFLNKTKKESHAFAKEICNLAKSHNITIIMSTSISRKMEMRGGDRIPRLSDFTINEYLEQHADKIIALYRPEYYGIYMDENGVDTQNILELFLVKNKQGSQNAARFKINNNFTQFCDDVEYDTIDNLLEHMELTQKLKD